MKKLVLLFSILSILSVFAKDITIVNNTDAQNKKSNEIIEKNLNSYVVREVKEKIKRNWTPPENGKNKPITASFNIDKNGKLSNIKIIKSSGDDIIDKFAIQAIEKASPFEPLLEGFNGISKPIEFTFDYEKFNLESKLYRKGPNYWGPYMRELEVSIKNNWDPPKGNATQRVIVSFTISKDGNLLDKKLVKSSGIPLADIAAMNAIQQTAPFKPLPSEFLGQSVPIEFTFDYNVLNTPFALTSHEEQMKQHLEQCKTKFCKFLYSHQ